MKSNSCLKITVLICFKIVDTDLTQGRSLYLLKDNVIGFDSRNRSVLQIEPCTRAQDDVIDRRECSRSRGREECWTTRCLRITALAVVLHHRRIQYLGQSCYRLCVPVHPFRLLAYQTIADLQSTAD